MTHVNFTRTHVVDLSRVRYAIAEFICPIRVPNIIDVPMLDVPEIHDVPMLDVVDENGVVWATFDSIA